MDMNLVTAWNDPRACALGISPYTPAILFETSQVVTGLARDSKYGTTRNTSEAVVGALGGAGGAIGGAIAGGQTGATIGTFVCPGPGTIVGAGVGATAGATMGCVAADYATKKLASEVFDHYEYNIDVMRCKKCNRRYKCRSYTSQSRSLCQDCDDAVKGL